LHGGAAHADLLFQLDRDIASIDALLGQQVDAILHHARFQRLEAAWRGLQLLAEQAAEIENVKLRVLNLRWAELARDLERAIEFDQSQLFGKVYSEQFGSPGGEPFGVLIGDYAVTHRVTKEHPTDDVATLGKLAQVAAAAFAPFITGADPALFGLDSFEGLGQPVELEPVFQQLEYLSWNTLRASPDVRFVGLVLPRILLRSPYTDDPNRVDGFRYREAVEAKENGRYLWGNAAFAFGAVLIRAFGACGWLADIRGVRQDEDAGGLALGLTALPFDTDHPGVALRYCTEVQISDQRDKALAELGLIPLCHCKDTPLAAFYSTPSLQRPKRYDTAAATTNARLSAMLQYMLCVARFGHYIKVIGRDKIGRFADRAECETFLQRWVLQYVTATDDASAETKATYPLREARVEVQEQQGKPGSFRCVMHLRPHFQLEEVIASVQLVTELTPAQPA
jgi:type VI secretion system protein ImpD